VRRGETLTAAHDDDVEHVVYLETWMVKDGALPELARASRLRGVGLRADCRNVAPARTATDGIAKLVDPGGE